jgi:hypothetical protein
MKNCTVAPPPKRLGVDSVKSEVCTGGSDVERKIDSLLINLLVIKLKRPPNEKRLKYGSLVGDWGAEVLWPQSAGALARKTPNRRVPAIRDELNLI